MAAAAAAVEAAAGGGGGTVLVTGGAGFIGTHTVVELVTAGYGVVIADNLCNSCEEAVTRVRKLVPHPDRVTFVHCDVTDAAAVAAIFAAHPIDAVIHFAALKAVGESVAKPLEYYDNNVGGLLTVLKCTRAAGVKRFVFSSSATVYGSGAAPFTEASLTGVGVLSPYGQTKVMAEQILRDVAHADSSMGIVLLRYFNPVGAHPSGTIGEDPAGVPNNLLPYIQRVASGRLPQLTVHGSDYPTPDGTAQRDYIHVCDLAAGHLSALQWLARRPAGGALGVFNLGTGVKYSVLDVVTAFERASGRTVPYVVGPRRTGDAAAVWADPSYAATELGWRATRSLDDMCADAWRWVEHNPHGYGPAATT